MVKGNLVPKANRKRTVQEMEEVEVNSSKGGKRHMLRQIKSKPTHKTLATVPSKARSQNMFDLMNVHSMGMDGGDTDEPQQWRKRKSGKVMHSTIAS